MNKTTNQSITRSEGAALLKALAHPISAAWQAIGYDAMLAQAEAGEGELTNADAIELACDADRLLDYGGYDKATRTAANEALKAACTKHGWGNVHRYLAKHLHVL